MKCGVQAKAAPKQLTACRIEHHCALHPAAGDKGGPLRRKRRVAYVPGVSLTEVDSLSYIDSIFLSLPCAMLPEEHAALELAVNGGDQTGKRRLVGKTHKYKASWIYLLAIHQPTLEAIGVLDRLNTPYKIVRVHVALDLIVDKSSEAMQLRDYVVARVVKSGRPSKAISFETERPSGKPSLVRAIPYDIDDGPGGTAYISRGTKEGVEVAMYGDRPTKTYSGKPCLHLEWRIRGAQALRSSGLRTLAGVALLDHREFWDKRLRLLRAPSAVTLTRALQIRSRSKGTTPAGPATPAVREASMLLHAHQINAGGDVVANDLLAILSKSALLKGKRPVRLFTREKHGWMLPPDKNALWGAHLRDDSSDSCQ